MDSGVGASVADGDQFPEFPQEESPGSRRGQTFQGPGAEQIPNKGQKKVCLATREGMKSNITFQDAKIRRPILAVIDAIRAGNIVIYGDKISSIIPLSSPEGRLLAKTAAKAKTKIALDEKDGVFVMPAWVVPPNNQDSSAKNSHFGRPGRP